MLASFSQNPGAATLTWVKTHIPKTAFLKLALEESVSFPIECHIQGKLSALSCGKGGAVNQ
jgi:hypothetical protein